PAAKSHSFREPAGRRPAALSEDRLVDVLSAAAPFERAPPSRAGAATGGEFAPAPIVLAARAGEWGVSSAGDREPCPASSPMRSRGSRGEQRRPERAERRSHSRRARSAFNQNHNPNHVDDRPRASDTRATAPRT